MNNIFQEFLDDFVVYYFDDILIFSKNEKDHEKHVQMILQKFKMSNVFLVLQTSIDFLSKIIQRLLPC
jgi:hypothetical protein